MCENSQSEYPLTGLYKQKTLPIEDKEVKVVGPVGFEPTTKGL